MTLSPLSDSAIVLGFGGPVDDEMLGRVSAVATAIRRHPPRGVTDVLPAFAQVTVFYDINRSDGFEHLAKELQLIAEGRRGEHWKSAEPRRVEVPVCYGTELGPDLDAVAAHAKLSAPEVIALHSGADYRVHAIGFAPGFAYLGGLPRAIAVPRRTTPRTTVAPGTVGIGGSQTGVYSLATPGGWNLVGRTPLHMFDPRRTEPALLQAGDRVKFLPIGLEEFRRLEHEGSAAIELRDSGRREGLNLDHVVPPAIEVLKAGMWTTVQDAGRLGQRAKGVPVGGGADPFAVRLVNWLVGNAEDCAVLEFTLIGPELRFTRDTTVALGGAEFGLLPRWQPIRVEAGSVIKMGAAGLGCRGYLAIAGGIEVPAVLGSRSTFVRAGFGGVEGRPLRDGDGLSVPNVHRRTLGHWRIDERILPAYSATPTVRVVRGAQAGEFASVFFATDFKVSAQSDRMGVRLTGPSLQRTGSVELASSAVVPGTVQVPPDGQPIILMADAQTLGGYPQVAHVITADLPVVAQLKPGDVLRFREITLTEAHQLTLEREHALAILQAGLAQKFA